MASLALLPDSEEMAVATTSLGEDDDAGEACSRGDRGRGAGRRASGDGAVAEECAAKKRAGKRAAQGPAGAAAAVARIASEWKKCSKCGKHKEQSEFNADQGGCKECYNVSRCLGRVAKSQQCEEEVERMQSENAKEYDALFRAYAKARDTAKKMGQKVRFSVAAFRVDYRSSSGTRFEAEGEMMWEGEYMAWSKGAKAGFLSVSEAEKNWQARGRTLSRPAVASRHPFQVESLRTPSKLSFRESWGRRQGRRQQPSRL